MVVNAGVETVRAFPSALEQNLVRLVLSVCAHADAVFSDRTSRRAGPPSGVCLLTTPQEKQPQQVVLFGSYLNTKVARFLVVSVKHLAVHFSCQ
eukprot:6919142-Pyramimonas_sp.AAC.2